jgi:hypothetical protein
MAYFKIESGVVVQKQPNAEDGFIQGPDDVICGFLYAKGKFSLPPNPDQDWPTIIETRRYQAEIAGMTFEGMRIDTDDRSKVLITGAALKAMRSADYVLRWKTGEGFVDLPAELVLIIADAVSDRTQLCFDREDALLGAVADGSITAAMVEEGWPA